MAVKKTIRKPLTSFQKVNDWYAKHNFGTRVAMFVFLGAYVMAVGGNVDHALFSSVDLNATQTVQDIVKVTDQDVELVKTVGYFAFAAMALVTLGDNALSTIGDIIVKVKGGNKDNSI